MKYLPAPLVALLLATAQASAVAPTKIGAVAMPPRILAANWAGDGFAVRASPTATIVQGKCASGKIDGPVQLDRAGAFAATGYFNRQRSGWRLSDISPRDEPADFYGVVSGNTLTLTIKRKGALDEQHALVRDAPAKFETCK